MSHELRTPLHHVIGFTELVREEAGPALSAEHREYLGDVLQSGRHLLSLLNDLLDTASVEAGRIDLELAEVPLAGLLEQSLTIVKDSAARAGITVSLQLDAIPPTGWLDARRINQVIYNLLSNAVKFTPRGGTVTLNARFCDADAREAGECLELGVSDTGIGLRAEDLERVFTPFERIRSDITRRVSGTGLGLSLSRKLVELHGGRIWAESAGEGKGTTVLLRLPIARPAPPPPRDS